jgi:hypothetical protein
MTGMCSELWRRETCRCARDPAVLDQRRHLWLDVSRDFRAVSAQDVLEINVRSPTWNAFLLASISKRRLQMRPRRASRLSSLGSRNAIAVLPKKRIVAQRDSDAKGNGLMRCVCISSRQMSEVISDFGAKQTSISDRSIAGNQRKVPRKASIPPGQESITACHLLAMTASGDCRCRGMNSISSRL